MSRPYAVKLTADSQVSDLVIGKPEIQNIPRIIGHWQITATGLSTKTYKVQALMCDGIWRDVSAAGKVEADIVTLDGNSLFCDALKIVFNAALDLNQVVTIAVYMEGRLSRDSIGQPIGGNVAPV